tara:strand:+ start:498 stop:1073 length:576 start_codon:yes stop_codon:yes gene_type:complete
MAFKMTPGIKGNSTNNSIMGGGCGGDGQPPCPPRFQAEKMMAPVADKSSSSRSKSIRVKKKAAVVTPVKPPKPVKFKINLPKGYGFLDKRQEAMFFDMFEQAISAGKYKTQEDLDMAVMKQLKGGKPRDPKEDNPFDPKDPFTPFDPRKEVPKNEGPIMVDPKKPVVVAPIKGGESKAVLSKSKAKSVAAK